MSTRAFAAAERQRVFELIADVARHPEWWPGVVEVELDQPEVAQSCSYREVIKLPIGTGERHFRIEELDDPSRFHIRCVDTGAFCDISLTEAQGGTFIEASAGIEDSPKLGMRAFDAVAGRSYWRRWLNDSVGALKRRAEAA